MAWTTRRKREQEPDRPQLVEDSPRRRVTSMITGASLRQAAARGVYRVFNAAGYRFYRSASGVPLDDAAGGTPYATAATLPATPATSFADGTWRMAVSYFNGLYDSGFLPIGPQGQTYRTLVIAGGSAAAASPSPPVSAVPEVRPGGIIRVRAMYFPPLDGPARANTWALTYTTDGTTPGTPPAVSPTVTLAMNAGAGGGVAVLSLDLPAQVHGTVVTVRVQTRRMASAGPVYAFSPGAGVLVATALVTGPVAAEGLGSWPGAIEE